VEILRGENSLKCSLKSMVKIHFGRRQTIADHQIWENYMGDSHRVFHTSELRKLEGLTEVKSRTQKS
jgi:hypothetical protein